MNEIVGYILMIIFVIWCYKLAFDENFNIYEYCKECGDLMRAIGNKKSGWVIKIKEDEWRGENICFECCYELDKKENENE